MSCSALQVGAIHETAERRLWRAVLARTVEERFRGPLGKKREAEQFLFTDNQDFRTICSSVGINPENLRTRLEKIRSRPTRAAERACASRE